MTAKTAYLTVTHTRRYGSAIRLSLTSSEGGTGFAIARDVMTGVRLFLIDLHDMPPVPIVGFSVDLNTWALLHVAQGELIHSVQGIDTSIEQGNVAAVVRTEDEACIRVVNGRVRCLLLSLNAQEISHEVRMTMHSLLNVDSSGLQAAFTEDQAVAILPSALDAIHVFSELYGAITNADAAYVRLKCLEIFSLYSNNFQKYDQALHAPAEVEPVVNRHTAIAYRAQAIMVADIAKKPTIVSLAQQCGTSPTVLKESFRETFGMPVYSWFKHYRMRCACEMMEADPSRSIASIAAEVGYANPSKFSHAFAECIGMAPYKWKESRR